MASPATSPIARGSPRSDTHREASTVPNSPSRIATRNANSQPACASTVSRWVSEKAPSAMAGMAATASSRASQPLVSWLVIRQCR